MFADGLKEEFVSSAVRVSTVLSPSSSSPFFLFCGSLIPWDTFVGMISLSTAMFRILEIAAFMWFTELLAWPSRVFAAKKSFTLPRLISFSLRLPKTGRIWSSINLHSYAQSIPCRMLGLSWDPWIGILLEVRTRVPSFFSGSNQILRARSLPGSCWLQLQPPSCLQPFWRFACNHGQRIHTTVHLSFHFLPDCDSHSNHLLSKFYKDVSSGLDTTPSWRFSNKSETLPRFGLYLILLQWNRFPRSTLWCSLIIRIPDLYILASHGGNKIQSLLLCLFKILDVG